MEGHLLLADARHPDRIAWRFTERLAICPIQTGNPCRQPDLTTGIRGQLSCRAPSGFFTSWLDAEVLVPSLIRILSDGLQVLTPILVRVLPDGLQVLVPFVP